MNVCTSLKFKNPQQRQGCEDPDRLLPSELYAGNLPALRLQEDDYADCQSKASISIIKLGR